MSKRSFKSEIVRKNKVKEAWAQAEGRKFLLEKRCLFSPNVNRDLWGVFCVLKRMIAKL